MGRGGGWEGCRGADGGREVGGGKTAGSWKGQWNTGRGGSSSLLCSCCGSKALGPWYPCSREGGCVGGGCELCEERGRRLWLSWSLWLTRPADDGRGRDHAMPPPEDLDSCSVRRPPHCCCCCCCCSSPAIGCVGGWLVGWCPCCCCCVCWLVGLDPSCSRGAEVGRGRSLPRLRPANTLAALMLATPLPPPLAVLLPRHTDALAFVPPLIISPALPAAAMESG